MDNDPFSTNQFLHPYQGSVYHGAARSAGLDFWQSMGYTFGGSLLWELAGETTPPSINDQVASGIGGKLLRRAALSNGEPPAGEREGRPGLWRELGAAAISPPTGFNRLAFGDCFDPVFPGRRPATYLQLRLGAGLTKELVKDNRARVRTGGASAEFKIIYGLPGKPGYSYERPFDYFDFQLNAVTTNVFESISAHGLLFGKDYAPNEDLRGVWGLYGIYDYFSPQAFRVSSTALAVGTTGQWWLSPKVALQGTGLAGLGYGAAGTIHGTGDRDYHYGLTPEGMLSMRLLFGDVADLDLTGREYFVTDVASSDISGTENILQGDASLTVSYLRPPCSHGQIRRIPERLRYPELRLPTPGGGNGQPSLYPAQRHRLRGLGLACISLPFPLRRFRQRAYSRIISKCLLFLRKPDFHFLRHSKRTTP